MADGLGHNYFVKAKEPAFIPQGPVPNRQHQSFVNFETPNNGICYRLIT